MPIDLAVLGQDPRFGGGGSAQAEAFLSAAAEFGREPAFLSDPHPGLGDARLTWRRVEALRQWNAAHRLERPAREARSLWVVASLAQNGGAASRTRRPYGCWIGTTIRSEWAGRRPGLPLPGRTAAAVSIPALASIERRVLRRAARVYATSPSSRADIAAAAGIPEVGIGLLPIPVDVDRLQPAPEETWREAVARPVLTFVGRADDPRKNLAGLLDSFARIRTSYPDACLRLVGRPPRGDLPEGVVATGPVDDVPAELGRAGLFVLPSRQEGFGIVVAEALACGLPVVTTPSRGPEDLVRASGGGLVTTDVADGVLSLLGEPDELAAIRRRGREYVAREHSRALFRDRLRAALAEVDRA